VPKTLLAVDDSATMRKVLEITFAGEDFRVVSAEGAAGALARMSEDPAAIVIDTSLGSEDGYALAKDIRARNARIAIVLLASRYAPYDPNRGREAGADDYVDKPFDTQSLIDKVKKAMTARETSRAAAPAPAPMAAVAAGSPATTPMAAAGFSSTQRMVPTPAAGTPGVAGGVGIGKASFPTQRTHTLSFEGTPVVPPAAPPAAPPLPITRTAPSGMPVIQPTPQAPTAPPAPGASAHTVPTAAPPRTGETVAAAAAAANGHLAGKLGDLGLTAAQAEAVLALSRELVERVVWEVVPTLAETIIKEEIARLTRDR
jgi:CheY-like chemotaxis protein